jgi:neutral ceramidase
MQALYEGLYTEQNVAISGIHTHSGPGGYLQFVLYDITSLGFVPQSYDALVYGILEVINIPLYKGPLSGRPFAFSVLYWGLT